jgi:hypothetical protein
MIENDLMKSNEISREMRILLVKPGNNPNEAPPQTDEACG